MGRRLRSSWIAPAIVAACGLWTAVMLRSVVHGQGEQPPLAVDDGPYLVARGAELALAPPGVLANDRGSGPLTARLSRDVGHGTLSLAADGSFRYLHDGSATLADGFRYRAGDGLQESTEATVSIVVTPVRGETLQVPGDYASIQQALDAASSGDLILVAPGTYRENLSLAKAVTLASWFLTSGDPAYLETTVLDGRDRAAVLEVPAGAEAGATVVGFTIQNADDGISARAPLHLLRNRVRWTSDGVDYEDGSGGTCRYNLFEENRDDGIDPDGAVDILIEHNTIRNNGGDGIEIRLQPYTGPMLHYRIRHNLIYGNQEDGIQLIDYDVLTDRRFEISRNAIYDNVQAGLGMMSGANTRENFEGASIQERIYVIGNTFRGNNHGMTGGDNAVVINNLFVGHPVLALKNVDGDSEVAFNLFHDNGSNASNANLQTATLLSGDPLLDAELRLLARSPAIDAGTAFYASRGETVLDLDASQYFGAAPDLGAFEWIPGTGLGPEAPDLIAPSDGALDVALSPVLRWQGTAERYELQIASDPEFAQPHLVHGVAIADAALKHVPGFGVLDHDTAYFWRVRGSDRWGTGSWSALATFTTEPATAPPEAPWLAAPLHGVADVALEPELAWLGAADTFRVQIALDPDFASPVLDTSVETKRLVPTPGVLEPATAYRWRVRGENSFGPGAWSLPFAFTTLPPPLPLGPPVGLRSPTQEPTSIELAWNESADPRVVAYAIYQDGELVSTESEPDGVLVGLRPDTLYHFQVTAIAADGGESLPSRELGVWTSTPPPDIRSLTLPVRQEDDDAEEHPALDGSVSLKSSVLELSAEEDEHQLVGLRFQDVAVAASAPILDARIRFTSGETTSEPTSLLIEGEASDDAPPFAKEHGNLSSRPRTRQAVGWEPPPWTNGASGAEQETPQLNEVVQEIVDRPGWQAGHDMVFLISGSGLRTALAYNGVPERGPVLRIDHLDVCGIDADGDGFACEVDCDEGDASVHPGATELCDGVDNDCDNVIDEDDAIDASRWFADLDADGYGDPGHGTRACTPPPLWVDEASDCNDGDASTFPGASETCNGRDDDCDGAVDEEYSTQPTACGVGACAATGLTSCVEGMVMDSCQAGAPAASDASCDGIDDDCDGAVDEDFPLDSCTTGQPGVCSQGTLFCRDGAAICVSDLAPAASDALCNGLDDDCDGAVDEEFPRQSCVTGEPGICSAGTTRCVGGEALCQADQRARAEACGDGLDNDCDGAGDLADADSCGPVVLSSRIDAPDDDAEEAMELGSVSLKSSDLELTRDRERLQLVGLRFRSVDVPRGATILGARLQFSADQTTDEATSLLIEAEASDDAATFSKTHRDLSSRPRTSHPVPWAPAPWTRSDTGPDQRTPELTTLVQEIVDRPAWSAGNAMAFLVSGTGLRTAVAYDGAPQRGATLQLEYRERCSADADGDGSPCEIDCDDGDPWAHPGGSEVCDGVDNDCDGAVDEEFSPQSCSTGAPGICSAGTTRCEDGIELCETDQVPQEEICADGLDNDCDGATDFPEEPTCSVPLSIAVRASEDDVEERISEGGSISLTSNDLELTEDGLLRQVVGLRFREVALPRGVEVLRASIQFTVDEVGGVPTRLVIEGEASDDAAPFLKQPGNLTSRPRTVQAAGWNPPAWRIAGEAGPSQRTPELAPLVQDIVDRPGWSFGNAVVFVLSGSGHRTAEAYDGVPERAAKLELEYLSVCGGDRDHDGFPCELDCDDADAAVHPGQSDRCNGVDDDCDGTIDEDYLPAPSSCGVGACQAAGSVACVDGLLLDSCQPGLPTEPDETSCNGVDDDCDGTIDEDYPPRSCSTGEPGICSPGTTRCAAGSELCEADRLAETEICDDGLDNDCDGLTDFPDDPSCAATP